MFPPANDSAQVRLRVDETQRLDAVRPQKMVDADVAVKKRKYSPVR